MTLNCICSDIQHKISLKFIEWFKPSSIRSSLTVCTVQWWCGVVLMNLTRSICYSLCKQVLRSRIRMNIVQLDSEDVVNQRATDSRGSCCNVASQRHDLDWIIVDL